MEKNKKIKIKYVCDACGAESLKWLGRCPMCGAWNSMKEFRTAPEAAERFSGDSLLSAPAKPVLLHDIDAGGEQRWKLSMPEVDRPLGGGIVPGSVILWGGEPGIGKSTLVLQICGAVSRSGRSVLYISGEESEFQIKMRASRLGMDKEQCFILSSPDLSAAEQQIEALRPGLLVIDSIQTMYLSGLDSPPGSPAQIRECTHHLVRIAKQTGTAVMIIGHVTKEGNLAGPRMLEHMVDVVLYLEGDRSYQFRVLRTVKNRFGSTAETGLFIMEEKGLREMDNPSAFLLRGGDVRSSPGNVIFCCMEGQRPVMAEIQALTVHSSFSVPRRISVGYDYNRMIILLAVLEKKAGLSFSDHDVYINVVSGFRITETAADLAAAMAMVSIQTDRGLPAGTAVMGEVGLTGEILPLSHVERRMKEAVKMGFSHFILPAGNEEEACRFAKSQQPDVTVSLMSHIGEAVDFLRRQDHQKPKTGERQT